MNIIPVIKYLKYIIRHKYYVFLECVKAGEPLLGIMHDLSKLLPNEFFPYVNHFYGNNRDIHKGRDETGYYKPTDTGDVKFDYAWFLHQKRNKHHWQYWTCPQDDGGVKVFAPPLKYAKEMLCDWRGAGKALGTPDVKKWYLKNKDLLQLHAHTRKWLEKRISVMFI